MAQKKNQNKQSGQLARQSQKSNNSNKKGSGNQRGNMLGLPSLAAPVAYSSPTLNQAPKISSSAKSTRIVHRELVATVSGITSFGSTAYALNPGLAASFPWLSSVAPSYEQYRFHRLRFHYVTRCATSYTGSVLLAPEYDALDVAPSTEVNMAMMSGAREDVPWRDQVLDFNVADMFPLGPRKYVRSTSVSSQADLKTYDAGQLFVALSTCADTSAIGKLWVEYDVELYIPQNPNATQSISIGAGAFYSRSASQALTSTAVTTILFDRSFHNGLGLVTAGGEFTLPVGKYFVQVTACFSTDGSAGADVSCLLELMKNGVSYPTDFEIAEALLESPTAGAQKIPLTLTGYFESTTSTDYLSIVATMTASGTLTLLPDRNLISILRIA